MAMVRLRHVPQHRDVSLSTVKRLIRDGKLSSYRPGGLRVVYVDLEEFDELVRSSRVGGSAS